MPRERILLVQCCHLPQFFYLAQRLRRRHPEWELSALVHDRPHVSRYLDSFPLFSKVFYFDGGPLPAEPFERLVFPLLNRGYGRIKRAAWQAPLGHWACDYEGHLHPLEPAHLLLSWFWPRHRPTAEFARFLERFPPNPLDEPVLIIESCSPETAARTERRWRAWIPKGGREVRVRPQPARSAWRRARTALCESAIVFWSGEPGFAFLKVLPLLLGMRSILVVNENGGIFSLTPRSLVRFFFGRIRHGVARAPQRPRILLIQTETRPYVDRALENLKQPSLYPDSEIILYARQADREHFERDPRVDTLLTYAPGWRPDWSALRRMLRIDPDLVAAIFSGRPLFRRAKLLYFLLPVRRRLAFNARLDCYQVGLSRLHWMWRREPLLFDSQEARSGTRVLVLQTSPAEDLEEVLNRLENPRVAPGARVTLFCPETTAPAFREWRLIDEIVSYPPGAWIEKLGILWRLARGRYDAVAAHFNGLPMFRKQKLLFFLLPARGRLVFNAHLDCNYLTWRNAWHLFGSERSPSLSLPSQTLLPLAKALLFLPRFLYLLLWAGGMKLRRAYRLRGS